MQIISGKEISDKIKAEIAAEVKKFHDEGKRRPHIAAILVGNDGASETYVAGKEKSSKEVGFDSSIYRFEDNITEQKLMEVIDFLNNDTEIDGFIVQLPLPKHIDVDKIINSINPDKDVDGFHPVNIGKMLLGQAAYLPATPHGVMQLLERAHVDTVGKNCVVIGRSNIVGTPVGILLSRNNDHANATVTICHTKTQNLKEICLNADIIIAAAGSPELLTADMVKEGVTIIDVGIHRIPDASKPKGFRLVGDVKFDEVAPKCKAITPVPGGVGPMTIVSLLQNTFEAYKKNCK